MNELQKLFNTERSRLEKLNDTPGAPEADYLNPVFGIGELSPILMIVGEAPGKDEAASGIPFVGKAGKQLDAFLSDAGIDRSTVYVTNCVKYRPVSRKPSSVSNRTPEKKEIMDSLYVLRNEIGLIKPKIIATFGNSPLLALRSVMGEQAPSGSIGELHGQAFRFETEAGETILFPMYHPASVIYNRKLADVLLEDTRALSKLTTSLKK